MDLLFHLFRRIFPIGLIGGVGLFLFSSLAPVATNRVDSFGMDASTWASSSTEVSQAAFPEDPMLVVRVTLDWSQIEPVQGEYNWSGNTALDLQIASLAGSKRKIIGVLSGRPVYLVSNIENPVDQTQLLLRWVAFVQAAVDRYGEQIHDWEIGSQINTWSGLSPFLYPQNSRTAVKPDPVLYAKLIKTASAVIKNTDANAEVWTGTLVGFTSPACALNPLSFLLELHGSKAWNTLDGVDYSPDRGMLAPEAQGTVTPECASGLGTTDTSLTGETRAVQDLIRQLGGKQVRISLPGWTSDNLAGLISSRNISQDQLAADLFTRASVPLLAQNGIPSVIWSIDPAREPAASAALLNLEKLLVDAKPVGQVQGAEGTLFEYRFSKGDQLIIVVWRSIEGDTAAPINLANIDTKSLAAFPVDAPSFDPSGGTAIPVDESKNALMLVNERPVVLIGKTSDLTVGIRQQVENASELAQIEVKQSLRHIANDQKAALKAWIASLFDSAKDQAINWGEEKLNEILN
ncbi:MAG: hypothetical protein ABFD24_12180 [Anaerolineaceae bacterium]